MVAVVIGARVVGSLSGSVGLGGFNNPEDVGVVQQVLKNKAYYGQSRVDKVCGPFTIQAIKEFQARYVMRNPDGLIQPGKNTWRKLNDQNPNLLQRTGAPTSATTTRIAPAAAPLKPSKINSAGLKIVKESEGLYLKAYLCPANVLTIGYGHTAGVEKGMIITEAQADAYLLADVGATESAVYRSVKVDLTSNQFSALVSFTFNVGAGNFSSSTLLKKLNAGDYVGAADQFLVWNKGGGKVLPGLVTRRTKERELFLKGDLS
ncbi:MAG: glycoside hydrolase family protein [Azoarcus sp.]|jgi:lysozyme|nr:glycoside hydrolase family protein [Azoarcus sp.]